MSANGEIGSDVATGFVPGMPTRPVEFEDDLLVTVPTGRDWLTGELIEWQTMRSSIAGQWDVRRWH